MNTNPDPKTRAFISDLTAIAFGEGIESLIMTPNAINFMRPNGVGVTITVTEARTVTLDLLLTRNGSIRSEHRDLCPMDQATNQYTLRGWFDAVRYISNAMVTDVLTGGLK